MACRGADLSQRRLAARLERDPATIGRWMSGATSPKWVDLEAIARVCGVPLSHFTDNHGPTPVNAPTDESGEKDAEAAQ